MSAEGCDLTLIDSNPKVLEASLERYDVMAIQGNCALMSVLNKAEIKKTDLLIAATGADEINLLSCMTAHKMNDRLHTIARIRNPEYSEQIYNMSGEFGLSLDVYKRQELGYRLQK